MAEEKLYPFHIVFRHENGEYDWVFIPAKDRKEAIKQFLATGAEPEVESVHLCKRPDVQREYSDPAEYTDPESDKHYYLIHENIDALQEWCDKMTRQMAEYNDAAFRYGHVRPERKMYCIFFDEYCDSIDLDEKWKSGCNAECENCRYMEYTR